MQGRADVGDVPNAETLGTLARKVLSSSRHAASRELARAVLQLVARSNKQLCSLLVDLELHHRRLPSASFGASYFFLAAISLSQPFQVRVGSPTSAPVNVNRNSAP